MYLGIRLAVAAAVLMLTVHGPVDALRPSGQAGQGAIGAQEEEYLREKYGLEPPAPQQPRPGGDWVISFMVRK